MPADTTLPALFAADPATGLAPLTPAQRAAVEAPASPRIVLAGPGTGKTRVLVYRAAYLLRRAEQPLPPAELVVITFSTKAAAQLRDRLQALIGPEAQYIRAGTIHHFCYDLIRDHHDRLGLPKHFLVADEGVTDGFWQPWCQRNGQEGKHRQVKMRISRVKLGLDHLPRDLRHGLEEYRHMLQDRHALDFDDLLTYARDLLRDHGEVRDAVHSRTGALLVDEFQDTDPVQYYIIRAAACPVRQGLFCVADDDQSIYGFRGARPRNVRDFIRDYSCDRDHGNLHILDRNYRSNASIFRCAEAVLDASDRIKRRGEVDVASTEDAPVDVVPCGTEHDQLRFVRETIRAWIEAGVPRREIAVLSPWNSQNAAFEDLLLRDGIPCDVSGTGRLMELPVLRSLQALLAFLHRTLSHQANDPELETLLARLLDQHAFGVVKGAAARQGEGLNRAFQGLVLSDAERHGAGLTDADRQQLDAAYALITNLLSEARAPSATVAGLVRSALPKLDGPLQLLAREGDRLRDPLSIPSFRFAARPLRTWIERYRLADPGRRPRLVVHHPDRHLEDIQALLVRQAFDEQGRQSVRSAAAPTLFDEGGDALSGGVFRLRDLTAGRQLPLGAGDVVLTTSPAAFAEEARRRRLLAGEGDGVVILHLAPERDAHRATRGDLRAAIMAVDEEGTYESPTVRLFKLLQAALAADAGPLYPEYVMVDVETTGVDPLQCRVVELGALRVVHGTVVSRFETRVALPPDLTAAEAETLRTVCGFTPADFDGAPGEEAAWEAFCAFAGACPLVAHNGQRFDFRVLDRLRRTYRGRVQARWTTTHDLLPDAVELFPDRASYRAEDLRRDLLEDVAATAHRALADCEDQQRLLTHFQEARAQRARMALFEPLLAGVAAALLFEADVRLADARSEEVLFLQTGYRWALRGSHPVLPALRRLLPGSRDVADAVRANVRLFDLVRDTAFMSNAHTPLDLEARLAALIAPFAEQSVHHGGLEALLVHLALWGEQTADTAADVVTLSTYHSAKGLEFDRVICTHVHGSAFPPYYAQGEEEQRESRRVLYVGMTRAMTHLVLTYPGRARTGRALAPSPFLRGLPPEYVRVRSEA